ncbi:MAG TPA: hypothetical protein VGN74_05655 [Brevundimonas sp.]|jgi:hypothetical protein|uniref:hypothetical protein n=1 Tax=Brevundimonas sp. TaxID=1871086 RepID=UPI002E0DDB3F|nr:hypothetical protein [Brevundimonas sp.]
MPADRADTTGEDRSPIPHHVRSLADAAVAAASTPGSHRVMGIYLAWLEAEAATVRRAMGLDVPHVTKDGRELYFTPVHGSVHRMMNWEPSPVARGVGTLALIDLLPTA